MTIGVPPSRFARSFDRNLSLQIGEFPPDRWSFFFPKILRSRLGSGSGSGLGDHRSGYEPSCCGPLRGPPRTLPLRWGHGRFLEGLGEHILSSDGSVFLLRSSFPRALFLATASGRVF